MEKKESSQRPYFWFSISVGIFVGLVFGFAGSSIVSSVKLHDAQVSAKKSAASGMMPSQIKHGGLGEAPHFDDLINQNSQKITSDDFKGKIQIVSFVNPFGVHSSPVLVSNLMNLYQELKESHLLGSKVVFVSYNLDPALAGPKVLTHFMKSIAGLDASDASNWEFLTGSEGSIGKIVAGHYAVHYRTLDQAAYERYSEQTKQAGRYLYAEAVNPLAPMGPSQKTMVGHDEVILVAPSGTIALEISQASAYPANRMLYDVVSMLHLPGMGKSH